MRWFGLLLLLAGVSNAQEPKAPPKKTGSDLYGYTKVWDVQITMTAAEYDGMQPANGFRFPNFGGPQPPPPPKVDPKTGREMHRNVFGVDLPLAFGSITVDGKKYDKVGIRYKGNGTYMESARFLKRSIKIDVDKFDDNLRIHGLKTLNLHCGVADPSKGRESFAYAIYRMAGVPAPRTGFAEVSLTVPGKFDKELLGLYTIVEPVDKNFLKEHYKNDAGLILKPERMRGLDYLGDEWEKYVPNYMPKRDATPAEAKKVIEFIKLVAKGEDEQFKKEIGNYLDVDSFLRFMAATAYAVNLDSFFALGHNYIMYLHPDTQKIHFIPWDVDRAIANFGVFGNADQQMDLNMMHPYAGECRLADRLLALPDVNAKYKALIKEYSATVLPKARLLNEVATIEKCIKESVAKDTKATETRKETGGFNAFFGKPPELTVFVEKRSASVEAQAAGKSQGYTPQAFGFGQPQPVGPAQAIARSLVQSSDTNRDGKLTEEEFTNGMKKLFREWDKNNAGTLDVAKITEAIQKMLPQPKGDFPPPKK